MHLPRAAFSHCQLDVLFWLLRTNNIALNVLSVKSIKNLETKLQSMHGIHILLYNSAFSNKFYVNSIADIISQVSFLQPLHQVSWPSTGNGQPTSLSTSTFLSRRLWNSGQWILSGCALADGGSTFQIDPNSCDRWPAILPWQIVSPPWQKCMCSGLVVYEKEPTLCHSLGFAHGNQPAWVQLGCRRVQHARSFLC